MTHLPVGGQGTAPLVRPEAAPREHPPASNLAQWAASLAGPVAFLLNHQVMYALVPRACVHGDARWPLHLSSLVALLVALGGAALARGTVRRARTDAPSTEGGALPRTRFMGLLGVVLSLAFAVFIVAQWMPVAMLTACEKSG